MVLQDGSGLELTTFLDSDYRVCIEISCDVAGVVSNEQYPLSKGDLKHLINELKKLKRKM